MRRMQAMLVLWVILWLASALQAQPQYTMTDLGTLFPTAIAGPWVVGREPDFTPDRLNIKTGERLLLPHEGLGAEPTGVLDSGEAVGNVGQHTAPVGHGPAAVWDAAGRLGYFPTPRGAQDAWVFGVNAQLAAAGVVYTAAGPGLAALWLLG
jgi:hypothetical protein